MTRHQQQSRFCNLPDLASPKELKNTSHIDDTMIMMSASSESETDLASTAHLFKRVQSNNRRRYRALLSLVSTMTLLATAVAVISVTVKKMSKDDKTDSNGSQDDNSLWFGGRNTLAPVDRPEGESEGGTVETLFTSPPIFGSISVTTPPAMAPGNPRRPTLNVDDGGKFGAGGNNEEEDSPFLFDFPISTIRRPTDSPSQQPVVTLAPVQKLDEMERPSLADLTNPPRNPTLKPTRRPRPTNVPTASPTVSMAPTTQAPVEPSRGRPTQAPFSPFLDIVRPTVLDTAPPAIVLKDEDDSPTEAPSSGASMLATEDSDEKIPTNKPTRRPRKTPVPTEEPTTFVEVEEEEINETEEPTWSPTTAKPRRTSRPSTEPMTEEPTVEPTSESVAKETLAPVFTEEEDTPKPTANPTTAPTDKPTRAPETPDPTLQPATSAPTTKSPTTARPTSRPTDGVTFSINTIDNGDNTLVVPENVDISYRPGNLTNRENGLLLSQGLTAKIIATAGQTVTYDSVDAVEGASSQIFHGRPDAGACFVDTRPSNQGGWVYVSNSEMRPEDVPDAANKNNKGGVGAITFDKNGYIKNYDMVLSETTWNCGGGRTPWNTWVSCEEAPTGVIWQVDPLNEREPQQLTMGSNGGRWESFAFDISDMNAPHYFVTEDHIRGALIRFTPSPSEINWQKPWGMLHGNGTTDYLQLTPNGQGTGGTYEWVAERNRGRENAAAHYPNCEGIDSDGEIVYFVSKKLQKLFELNLRDNTYTVESTIRGLMDGRPDQVARILTTGNGEHHLDDILYFTEEGGVDAGVHGRDSEGNFFTILESPVYKDETSGLAFSPDGKHMYIAYQENGVLLDVTRLDSLPFHAKSLNVKYHAKKR